MGFPHSGQAREMVALVDQSCGLCPKLIRATPRAPREDADPQGGAQGRDGAGLSAANTLRPTGCGFHLQLCPQALGGGVFPGMRALIFSHSLSPESLKGSVSLHCPGFEDPPAPERVGSFPWEVVLHRGWGFPRAPPPRDWSSADPGISRSVAPVPCEADEMLSHGTQKRLIAIVLSFRVYQPYD